MVHLNVQNGKAMVSDENKIRNRAPEKDKKDFQIKLQVPD
jgi:hypothetical protein